jgi:glycosyltransferase involved in cell wall biosynthesis
MLRLLYIKRSEVPPPKDPNLDQFFLLSEAMEGDVLQPIWFATPERVEREFGPGSYPVYQRGRFRYHWYLAYRHRGVVRRKLGITWFFLKTSLRLSLKKRFDCVTVYGHMTSGLCGLILKALTGTKLIVEVVTSPELIFRKSHNRRTFGVRLMRLYSDICLHLSLWCSNRAHLLYPTQLAMYKHLGGVRSSIFHDFVTLSAISTHSACEQRYILLVGAPWYLKGADVLVRAFKRLSTDFPNVRLKLLGHFDDRKELEALVGDSPQIEILKAKPHSETLPLISEAAIVVLPSRCEGLPRVIIEAMGAGVAVIGSNVGGIPTLVRDGESGFLVPPGDDCALEERLRQMLSDHEMRQRMGAKGYDIAHSSFGENVYVRQFSRMIELTVRESDGQ